MNIITLITSMSLSIIFVSCNPTAGFDKDSTLVGTIQPSIILPTVTINSPFAITNVNAPSYTLSGTCSEEARSVSLSIGGSSFFAMCAGESWSTTEDLSSLSDGTISILADHVSSDGHSAVQASTSTTKDVGATITILNIAGDDNIDSSEDDTPLTVAGSTTGVEDGRSVSISFGPKTYSAIVNSNAWSFDIPVIDLQNLLTSLSGNNLTSNSVITTDVTSWYGTTSLARLSDGNISTSGANDYQVHPMSADGKKITLDLVSAFTGGNFIFYNRIGCCSNRIMGSTVDFKLNNTIVQSGVISSSANIITIAGPVSAYDEIVLTFSGAAQNFREIEVVPAGYAFSVSVTDLDGNSASALKTVTHNL